MAAKQDSPADDHGTDYAEMESAQVADNGRRALLTTDLTLNAAQREWLMLACAVDRVVFVVYCVAFAVMMSVYL